MTAIIVTVLVSLTVAFLALETTLRIDPTPTPLPLEGWTP